MRKGFAILFYNPYVGSYLTDNSCVSTQERNSAGLMKCSLGFIVDAGKR